MKLSFERQVQVGFGIAMASIATMAVATLRSTAATVESAGWVAHTLEVRATLATTLRELTEAETAARGYVITGRPRFLAPYDSVHVDVDVWVTRLRRLTADNGEQQARLDTLQSLIPAYLSRLQRTIDVRRAQGAAPAAAIIATGEGEALLGDSRQLITHMDDHEGQLLVRRSATLAAKARLARQAAWGGSVLAVALAGLAIGLLSRQLAGRRRAEGALRESERRLTQLLEAIPVGVFVLDALGASYYANKKAQEILGKGIVPGTTARDLPEVYRAYVPGTDELYPADRQPIAFALRGEHAHAEMIEIRRPDRTVPIEVWAAPVLDSQGRVTHAVAAFGDVTERERAQHALRESEERYRRLFESNPLPAWVFDVETLQFLAVNDAAVRAYGYSRDEFLSMTIADIRPAEDVPALRKAVGQVATGHAAGGVWRHRTKDGALLDVEITSHELRYGERHAELVLALDITARQRAEKALRASEERFRLLVGAVRDYAIFMLDPTGHVATWNRGAQQIKGYAAEEILGRHFSCFYPPDAITAGTPEAALRAAADAGRFEEENWRLRKDGTRFWADVVITAVRDERGALLGFAKVTRDLTERKRAEREIQARTAQLEAANKELEAFSYSVSHDLRAPLRSIDGFSQALEEDSATQLDATGQDHLRRVRAATKRMERLIDDLLHLARVSRSELRSEPVDLTVVARSVAADLAQREPARTVAFVSPDRAPVRGDPALLRILLENLLGNAWKFTAQRAAPRVEFGVISQDGRPVYFVRDNGAGFDMAYIGKLFGAFQRLHGATEFPGTGIGLATVQRIVHRHGGRIWAEGAVDQGATFYFTL